MAVYLIVCGTAGAQFRKKLVTQRQWAVGVGFEGGIVAIDILAFEIVAFCRAVLGEDGLESGVYFGHRGAELGVVGLDVCRPSGVWLSLAEDLSGIVQHGGVNTRIAAEDGVVVLAVVAGGDGDDTAAGIVVKTVPEGLLGRGFIRKRGASGGGNAAVWVFAMGLKQGVV